MWVVCHPVLASAATGRVAVAVLALALLSLGLQLHIVVGVGAVLLASGYHAYRVKETDTLWVPLRRRLQFTFILWGFGGFLQQKKKNKEKGRENKNNVLKY